MPSRQARCGRRIRLWSSTRFDNAFESSQLASFDFSVSQLPLVPCDQSEKPPIRKMGLQPVSNGPDPGHGTTGVSGASRYRTAVDFAVECEWLGRVESRCGAVAVGRT